MTGPWIVICAGWGSFFLGVILLAVGQQALGWTVLLVGGLAFAVTTVVVIVAARRSP